MKHPGQIIFSYRRSAEGGYEAHAVGHSIFTQAKTLRELKLNVAEAVRAHFGDEGTLPEIRFLRASRFFWFGSAKGEFTVPDDFNDPLPKDSEDLFWK